MRADEPTDWWRLGEQTGATIATDSAGSDPGRYSPTGINFGTEGPLADGDNTAVTLNGTTGTVQMSNEPDLEFSNTQSFSVEAWVKTTDTGIVYIASTTNGSAQTGWDFGLQDGDPFFALVNDWPSNALWVSSASDVADGKWHQLVATYNGSSTGSGVTIYVDGSAVTSTPNVNSLTASPATTAPIFVGSSEGEADFFDGSISDVSVYPSVDLSATRVAAHYEASGETSETSQTPIIYNTPYPESVEANSPIAYWRLGDSSGTTATDSWGASNGTYHNVTLGEPGGLQGDPSTSAAFNGSSSYVQLPNQLFHSGEPISVEAWINTTHPGPVFGIQSAPMGSTAPGTYDPLMYIGANGSLDGGIADALINGSSAAPVDNGHWHLVALTYDGNGNVVLYVDGQAVADASGANSYELANSYAQVGGAYFGGSWPNKPTSGWGYFDGDIQDVSVYSSALTSAQIQPQFQAGSLSPYASAVEADQPLSFWRLGDSTGSSTASDSVGGNAGTYTISTGGSQTLGEPGPINGDPTTSVYGNGGAYVGLPSGILAGSQGFSIEAWFNVNDNDGPIFGIQSSPMDGSTPAHYDPLLYLGSDANLHGGIYPAVNMTSASSGEGSLNNNEWHYAVLTDDGDGDLALYLDGRQVGTESGANQAELADATYAQIAGAYMSSSWPEETRGNGSYWDAMVGDIGDVAVYNYALTATQVAQHYQAAQTVAEPGPNSDVHTISVTDQQYVANGGLQVSTTVAGASFDPNYGLTTQTTDPDGDITATSYSAANGIGPQYGLPTSTTENPGGLNLTTTTSYETPGSGSYLRVTGKTLPAGNETTYVNYCGSPTDSTCASPEQPGAWATACGVADGATQYGLVAEQLDPAPVGGSGDAIEEQYLYDQNGRQVGIRTGTANTISTAGWDCTTYDAEGRITAQSWPTFNGQPALTVTYTYGVPNGVCGNDTGVTDPLINEVTESDWSGQAICSTVDLLDRTISYTDIWGNPTTTAYDQAGQQTATSGPQGDLTYGYNNAGQATTTVLGGSTTLASDAYDNDGRLQDVFVANANDESGGEALYYDANGRQYARGIYTTAGFAGGEADFYSAAGRVINQDVYANGQLTSANGSNPDYTYDAAGRLTQAALPGASYNYSYAATTGCPDNNAGENTNRTTLTITGTGAGTTSYCYDNADRLVSTSAIPSGEITYDNHGNMTQEGNETFTYDASDQLIQTDSPGNVTVYARDPLQRVAEQSSITPITTGATATGSALSSTSVSAADPSGAQAGDELVAALTVVSTSALTATGWTVAASQLGTNGHETWVLYRTATADDPSSWTFSLAGSTTIVASITDFKNPDPTAPIDVTAGENDSVSTTQPLPRVTTASYADTVLHVVGYNADVTPSAPAGDTQLSATRETQAALLVSEGYQLEPGKTPAESATSLSASAASAITVGLVAATSVQDLGYTGQTDASDITQNIGGTTIGTSVSLAGGITYNTNSSGATYSYANNHGDTITTTNSTNSSVTWTGYWGPYGENATGTSPPTNTALANTTLGYNGGQGKLTNTASGITLMGARPYQASTGRFIQPDPVQGGCANAYTYAFGDPINHPDLSGKFGFCHAFSAQSILKAGLAIATGGDWSDALGDIPGLSDAVSFALKAVGSATDFGRMLEAVAKAALSVTPAAIKDTAMVGIGVKVGWSWWPPGPTVQVDVAGFGTVAGRYTPASGSSALSSESICSQMGY